MVYHGVKFGNSSPTARHLERERPLTTFVEKLTHLPFKCFALP